MLLLGILFTLSKIVKLGEGVFFVCATIFLSSVVQIRVGVVCTITAYKSMRLH